MGDYNYSLRSILASKRTPYLIAQYMLNINLTVNHACNKNSKRETINSLIKSRNSTTWLCSLSNK